MIVFFGYRDWAIDIFRGINKKCDDLILMTGKEHNTYDKIKVLKPDLLLFYGWSWFVPKEIIENYFCVCLHPSKLPKYRGGSPIQNQIMSGENESAVTLFKMNNELDNGPILFQKYFPLDGYLDDIFEKIIKIGTEGSLYIIDSFFTGNIKLTPQEELDSTYCKRREPDDSIITSEIFSQKEAKYFYNMVRGLQPPYPMATIICKNETRLILEKVSYE
jgi:methionyl-tRNA formyltransferase